MGLKSLTLETRNPNRPEPNPIRYRYIVSYNIMVPIFLKNISPLLYFFNIMLSIFQTNFFFKTTIYVSKQTSFFKLQSMFPNNFFLKLQFMFPTNIFLKMLSMFPNKHNLYLSFSKIDYNLTRAPARMVDLTYV